MTIRFKLPQTISALLILSIIGVTSILFHFAYGTRPSQIATLSSVSWHSGTLSEPDILPTGDINNGTATLTVSGSVQGDNIAFPVSFTAGNSSSSFTPADDGSYTGEIKVPVPAADPTIELRAYDGNDHLLGSGSMQMTATTLPGGSLPAQRGVAYMSLLAAVIAAARLVVDFSSQRKQQENEITQQEPETDS